VGVISGMQGMVGGKNNGGKKSFSFLLTDSYVSTQLPGFAACGL